MAALGEKQVEIHDGVFPSVSSEFKNKHILLVEDNELNRRDCSGNPYKLWFLR